MLALVVGGCTTVTKDEYKTAQVALRESPSIRKQAIAECMTNNRNSTAADRANLAAFLRVSEARAPAVFCSRIFSAVADGRISYEDLTSANRTGNYSVFIRALTRG